MKNYDSQNGTLLFNLTQRIEPFSILLKELNPFQHMTRRFEHFFNRNFFNMTQRMKFFQYDLKSWTHPFWWFTDLTFLVKWVKYLNPFWTWLKELNFFSSDSHSWALFWNCLTKWNFLKLLLELSFFDQKLWKNWKNWTLLGYHSKRLNFFFGWKYDSKNLFLLNLTERIVPSFFHDSNTWTFFTWLK